MIRAYVLLIGIAVGVISCSPEESNSIQYEIAAIHNDSIHQLKVTMSFLPSQDGITVLEYPDNAWGQENLHEAIKHMELQEVQGEIETDKDSGWVTLKHPKDLKRLQFQYILQQDFENPIGSRKVYRPIIQPEYFHLFSHNLFMVPKTIGDTINVNLYWKGFKVDEVVHHSFGSNKKQQRLENIPKTQFLESIFVGGDFKVDEITIKGSKVFLATRGDWVPFSVDEMKTLLEETIKYQRNFWDDHSQPYFTVTMQPIFEANGSSYQGTGLTNSFATSFSNNTFLEKEQMVHLFNHELMHNWIGLAIKNKNEEEQYWFSEGFTEYYTHKNVAKNRINGLDGSYFIDAINDLVRNLYSLSIKEVPNSEMNYENFWSNPEYQKLPYYRGALFAFYLDYSIMEKSQGEQSLDNLMKDLLTSAKEEGKKLDHSHFLENLRSYLPDNAESMLQTYIENGKLLPLVDFYGTMGLEYTPEIYVYDLGFQFTEDKRGIYSVVEGSEAEKAGLQSGDRIISQSIWFGNAEIPVEIGVDRDGKQLKFSYLPVKAENAAALVNSKENIERLRL
ncbi:M1 family aminopeptidase [Flagellimonas sp.]|uniref:M1 family aminopeptidase n=1 Tax=Flagellimonas sp. TaxID=2058762 RepID=UPI003B509536